MANTRAKYFFTERVGRRESYDRRERAALAYGYLRFHVDSPVTVEVAVPVNSIPFWIADQSFEATNLSLENCDGCLVVCRQSL